MAPRKNSILRQSLRFKLLAIYFLVILCILAIILLAFPRAFLAYMIRQTENDLLTTRQIIQETLEKTELQTNVYLQDRLDAVARAKKIEIWICKSPIETVEETTVIPVLRLGASESSGELQLSAGSARLIEAIRNGQSKETMYENLFPEFFTQNTITLAYTTDYVENRTMSISRDVDRYGFSVNVKEKAVILLNIEASLMSRDLEIALQMVLLAFAILSILTFGIIWYLSDKMLQPISQMREIAQLITQGDFSRKVEITTTDEIGELAYRFNEMAKELQEVEQNRQEFIANVSHDFRSPLTSIHGFVQAMLDEVIPVEQYPKYLGIVFDETNRLSKLTNDLLLLSRMQSGQAEVHPVRFDINELIRKLMLSFEQRIEEKKICVRFHFLQEKLYVSADRDQIERVIYNLVDNAIKFTRENDEIIVETSIVNRKAYISVADTGIGMDEESLRHIFERFHKIDKSRGLNKTGMGLGLAIVKQIIANHGEKITVTSHEGQGTRFEFALPLSSQLNLVEKE